MSTGVRADVVRRRPVEWIWRTHVPRGSLTLLGGLPGAAKSLFAVEVAADVTDRGERVLFCSAEDSFSTLRARLEAAGADLRRVRLEGVGRLLPRDGDSLRRVVDREHIRLAVLDPLPAYLSASMSRGWAARQAAEPLVQLAADTGAAVLGITHTVKGGGRLPPIHAIGGASGGVTAAARVVFILGIHPEETDVRILAAAKCNVGPLPPALAFEFEVVDLEPKAGQPFLPSVPRLVCVGEEAELDAASLLAGATRPQRPAPEKAHAARWLEHYLSAGPRPGSEIREDAQHMGISWSTVRRARDLLGVLVKTEKRPGFATGTRSLWSLPPDA